MTAIMTAFASGENRSMLNQPFLNGKGRVAHFAGQHGGFVERRTRIVPAAPA
ncbi:MULTISPECIES: hypothetical protein [unclassified Burkholderia]|nr:MULTISPECIES: hypothetical protein [unclassified Burkholderia]